MNNRNPWTTAGFQKRLKEFMRDNPDLTKSEACSILGKRGAENRKKSQLSRCENKNQRKWISKILPLISTWRKVMDIP